MSLSQFGSISGTSGHHTGIFSNNRQVRIHRNHVEDLEAVEGIQVTHGGLWELRQWITVGSGDL